MQGGVAFAAFGALGVAAAVPAHAENGEIGFARATVAGEGRIIGFYPRGGDVGGYGGPLYDGEVFSDSLNRVRVDVEEDDLYAEVFFRELRIELTEADVEAMRAAAGNGESQPGLENSVPGGADSGEAGGETDEVVLRASFVDTNIVATQDWAGDREFSHDPGTESVEVNELGAEISFSTEEAPWSDSRVDWELGRVQLWGGVQTLDMVVTFPDEGFSVSYEVGETIVASDTEPGAPEEPGEDEEPGGGGEPGDGEPGGDGGTGGGEPGGEGGTGGGDGGGTGDGSGQDGDSGDEGNDDEADDGDDRDPSGAGAGNGAGGPLAQTGTPVAGLVAAGAAIAAGGGAAVYAARRRRNASAPAEGPGEG
ncbi:hypothetical protein CQJ94_11310 [Glycomyces fuscus]|nr:hypothetical protein CQJ94_11310 [Glycomyces fuscus]